MDSNPSILVASLWSCGTFFMLDEVLTPFRKFNIGFEPTPGSKQQFHLFEPDQDLLQKRISQCFTIIPYRKFDSVVRSWSRAGLSLETLHTQWAYMAAMVLPNGMRIGIEDIDRDEQLAALSARLGVELTTDWAPTNIGYLEAES